MRILTAAGLLATAAGTAYNVAAYANEPSNTVPLGCAIFLGLLFVINLVAYAVRGN